MNLNECLLCQRIKKFSQGHHPYCIHEFPHSLLFLGEHQFYPGYCVLYSKDHVREMIHLPVSIQQALWDDLRCATEMIMSIYRPMKMNYASLGNQVEHLHWHIFPRYQEETHVKEHPWYCAEKFSQHHKSDEEVGAIVKELKNFFKKTV